MDEHDELLIAKWLMLGGVLWDAATGDSGKYGPGMRFFAIEPGYTEHDSCRSTAADTPADAICKYIWIYGVFSCLLDTEHERSLTASAHGHTTNPMGS